MIRKFLECCLLLALSVPLKASVQTDSLAGEWVGNWVHKSGEWKYGFFEKFAIYDADFWEYETIHHRKRQTDITLVNGDRKAVIHIRKQKEGVIEIADKSGKFEFFYPVQKGFYAWPGQDTSFFYAPHYKTDTVRILGYYRNLRKFPDRKVVTIYRKDFVRDEQLTYYADIDSLGRFQISIPVSSLESLAVDWGFLNKKLYVEPSEKVLLFADAEELARCNRSASREEYWTQERNILFMGKNARFHTEFAYCPLPLNIRGYYSLEHLPDMQLQDSLRKDLADYREQFRKYREQYPNLSRRCVELVDMNALFQTGSALMQYKFELRKKDRSVFEPGYMDYIRQAFPLDCEWFYLADNYFGVFCRDYCDYMEQEKAVCVAPGVYWYPSSVTTDMLFDVVRKERWASSLQLEQMRQYQELSREAARLLQLKDTVGHHELWEKNKLLNQQIDEFLKSDEIEDLRLSLVKRNDFNFLDSLLADSYLLELMTARKFTTLLEVRRQPFGKRMLALLDEKITNSDIKKEILIEQEKYHRLMNKEITWLESLKNTEHLKDYKDSKKLLQQLIAPYKGNVIYLDIWGTWCQPCREQMKYVGEVKKALKDKKVIFMYLANGSEEKTWKNVIREYDLTGENVVHYRLPDEQQQQLERLLGITGYPTFMLLDQEGEIVNPKAPRPQLKDELVREIHSILKDLQ